MKRVSVCLVPHRFMDDLVLCVWNDTFNGWCLPGGKIEGTESPAAAAIRELKEETGLSCRYLVPVDKNCYQAPDGWVEVNLFLAVVMEMAPIMGERGTEPMWLERENLTSCSPFKDYYRSVFKELEENGRIIRAG